MYTLFISDLHLNESRPHITRAFFQFLHKQTKELEALYILGDFFDTWIGDDDDAALNAQVAAALKELNQRGTQIYLMHGNRDFLLGEKFAKDAGASLIPEGSIINLYGCPTLLLHGDNLCIEDKDYIKYRQQVRSAQWQQHILAQPLAARRLIASQLREKSQTMNSLKAEDILDVTHEEVVRVLQEARTSRLIHGHTHRPARHTLIIEGNPSERIVLGDWHDQAWAIIAAQDKLELIHWHI